MAWAALVLEVRARTRQAQEDFERQAADNLDKFFGRFPGLESQITDAARSQSNASTGSTSSSACSSSQAAQAGEGA